MFCDDRVGVNGKDEIVERLNITHFIDDRDEILKAINDRETIQKRIKQHNGKLIHFVSDHNAYNSRFNRVWSPSQRPEHFL